MKIPHITSQNHPKITPESSQKIIPKNHPMSQNPIRKSHEETMAFAWRCSPDVFMRGDLPGGRIACGVNGILGAVVNGHRVTTSGGMEWGGKIADFHTFDALESHVGSQVFYI